MDDAQARATLVTVCAGLARLQLRLLHAHHAAASNDDRRLREVKPASPWLDARDPNLTIVSTIDDVALATAHLLGMVESHAPVDAKYALLALQHIQGEMPSTWGTPTLRLAARLGYTLAGIPLDEFHGAYLTQRQLPRAARNSRATA